MSNPTPPYLPVPGPDDDGLPGDGLPDDDIATREVDGETVLDPDANDDLIDSAAADRVAAGDEDTPPESVDDVPAGGAGADSGAADAVRVDPDDEASIPDISETNDTPGVGTRREE
ncbi:MULTISPECIES: hypothetical protein [Microbacterium]|uniref:hypothetical protein n=1 Tax=Microbacterium TaxID=33882 RepID=UPI00217E364C|nr:MULTISPECIES: hypothetical protein [Microbacterium]UWF76686.1 hypothetical protein JSY13_07365 [Microbacterium neungamense]WCM54836.1 hypothetical protein JRG78_07365 [Microbacterium sp. EF45047]